MESEHSHGRASPRLTSPPQASPPQASPSQAATPQAATLQASGRLAQALDAAGLAFFDYRPDWARDPSGYQGAWHWSGARFGIDGVDSADGASCLVDAAAEDDLNPLLEALSLQRVDAAREAEFRVERDTGETRHLLCDVRCDLGADGRPAALFGTVQDVTRQRRAEATLIENARRDHVVLASIDFWPVGVAVIDVTQPHMPLIYVNRMFSRMTGYDSGAVIGHGAALLHGPDTDPEAVAAIAAAIARGERADVCLVNHRKDGTPFLNRVILDPIRRHDGKIIAYMNSYSDITEDAARRAEAARRDAAARERMLGEVAHQINNMLQPVTLLAQDAIDKGLVAEEGRGHLDILLECSKKARHIIAERLAVSQPAPRRVEVHDPVTLLNESLRLVRQAIPSGLDLRVRIDGHPPPVMIDRVMFVEILLNLATNAAEALDGRGGLTITLDEETPGDDRIAPLARFTRLRVIDGERIRAPVADEDADFEPFFTTKPNGLGTGLGFPVVCGLVREIGGTIALNNDPDGRTTATVLFPGHFSPGADRTRERVIHAGH